MRDMFSNLIQVLAAMALLFIASSASNLEGDKGQL